MDVLKESLELIQKTAVRAAQVETLDCGNPRERLLVDRLKGDISKLVIPPPLRSHKVESVESLAALAKDHPKAACWVNMEKIVLVLDADDRREQAEMALLPSRQFRLLSEIKDGIDVNQRDLLKLLRFDLGADASSVDKWRRLTWGAGATTTSDRRTKSESLGAEITAKVSGVDELPDEILVGVPVLRNREWLDVRYLVALGIEMDARNQVIHVEPLPNELDRLILRATNDAEATVLAALKDARPEKTPVFRGTP